MQAVAPASADFYLDGIRVCPGEGLLRSAKGETQLEPRVMAVLEVLAQSAGQVVSRDQLLDAVWGSAVVSDDALNRCVYQLRHELPPLLERPQDEPVIETLRKRGYRLNLSVTQAAAPPQPANRQPRTGRMVIVLLVVLGLAAAAWWTFKPRAAAEPIASIAVLPFLNLTGDDSLSYLADGFSEQLAHALGNVAGLRVAARTSAFYFKNRSVDVPEICRQLGVAALIEGSIRRQGGELRVTVQAGRADGYQLWSGQFDRALAATVTLQSDIAREVLAALDLAPPATETPGAAHPASFSVVDAYLRGRHALAQQNFEEAKTQFERAVLEDEQYALGYTGLADTLSLQRSRNLIPADTATRQIEPLLETALRLDPDLAEAHASRGLYLFALDRFVDAEPHLRRAVELNPNYLNAHNWLALDLVFQDRFNEAVAAYRRATELDPLDVSVNRNLGVNLLLTGQPDDGLGHLTRVRDLAPEVPLNDLLLAHWSLIYGRLDSAGQTIDQGLAAAPGHTGLMSLKARWHMHYGNWEEALELLRQAWASNPQEFAVLEPLLAASWAHRGAAGLREALELLSTAESPVHGQDSIVLRWQLLAALADGQHERVIELFESAPENTATCGTFGRPGPRMYYGLALKAREALARYREVAEACLADARRVVANGGDYPDLQVRLAAALLHAGQPDAAAEAFTRAISLGWRGHYWVQRDPVWDESRSWLDALLRAVPPVVP